MHQDITIIMMMMMIVFNVNQSILNWSIYYCFLTKKHSIIKSSDRNPFIHYTFNYDLSDFFYGFFFVITIVLIYYIWIKLSHHNISTHLAKKKWWFIFKKKMAINYDDDDDDLYHSCSIIHSNEKITAQTVNILRSIYYKIHLTNTEILVKITNKQKKSYVVILGIHIGHSEQSLWINKNKKNPVNYCVCVCVCFGWKERERERDGRKWVNLGDNFFLIIITIIIMNDEMMTIRTTMGYLWAIQTTI